MARAVVAANRREQDNFRALQRQWHADIEEAAARTGRLKLELEAARRERAHLESCELIRQQIAALPSRQRSHAALAALRADVAALEAENAAAGRVLELRRKQFALLMHTMEELQGALEEDPSKELANLAVTAGGAGLLGAGQTDTLTDGEVAEGVGEERAAVAMETLPAAEVAVLGVSAMAVDT
eukprot:TRINITY_DN28941_c0_g1_i1.p2 TRINITY_DN28941_c0_g1~~TRINITY_DN28941_c0_g1_i1.p2  ORF type:complete len:192 (-),score=15.78 TRINITY_DN28941_c0_g1_i1:51-602(-)